MTLRDAANCIGRAPSLPESVLLASPTGTVTPWIKLFIRFRRAARLSLAVLAAFAGIYIIWGTTYLAIAFAIQTMPPFISGVARFGLAGLLMYVWLRARNPRPFAGVNMPMVRSPACCCRASAMASCSWRSKAFRAASRR